ncbi:hypothetical protein [Mycolicibacterium aubagnense]|uniref:hypothetical protein n=1 Tax=Mycolicibacterium aubagnense TaxID=319707 RepID=UPI0010FE251F|nr:hypothetical protein [Mycolicibacterium aubagnense]TLH70800.1 hypothetical protein C1S80_00605 [Mycolicibacterium aubagnense]WGI32717.1 hypothetical protein QDT91_26800 [Mycolicibacterium aubagnense]
MWLTRERAHWSRWCSRAGPVPRSRRVSPADQAPREDDQTDEQAPQEPHAETKAYAEADGKAEEREPDSKSETKSDPYAGAEAAGATTATEQPPGEQVGMGDDPGQVARRDAASQCHGAKAVKQPKSAGAEADSGACGTGGEVA